MNKNLFLVPLVGITLSSCGTISETMNALECNKQAVERSTQAIQANRQAIEEANQGIEENRRQLDAINKALEQASES